jgi:pimeloyl-ACP methyl ester carboxylesterase
MDVGRIDGDDELAPRGGLDFEVVGSGPTPTVVLVHGAPDRASTFKSVLPHLGAQPVALYDRRGYGRSVGWTPPTSMADHAEDLIALIQQVERPCVAVAHSFGSNPTMLAATRRPDLFAAIGLWEPPIVWVDWWPQSTKDYHAKVAASDDPARSVESMYRRILGRRAWDALPTELREQRRAEGPAFRLDMASALVTPFAFEDVTVPAVVGYGRATTPEHIYGAAWLAEHLPDAQLHPVADAGHFANRTHPAEFARFVEAAVERGSVRSERSPSAAAEGCPHR